MSAKSTSNMDLSPGATVFKRVKLEASNGRPPIQYRIQLADESLIDEAARFMETNFFPNANLCNDIELALDKEEAERTHIIMMKMLLSKGLSLVALLEDAQGNRGPMISCNVLLIENKDKKDAEHSQSPPSGASKKIMEALETVEAKADVFSLYDCEAYIYGAGLSVASDWEGRGIGSEMLRARVKICRMTNIPVSATVFTGHASQKMADRCGYETLAELNLTNFRINGEIAFRDPLCPIIKWMAKRHF